MTNNQAKEAKKLNPGVAFEQYTKEMNRNVIEKAEILRKEMPELKAGDLIVDVGCASGQVLNELASISKEASFIGVDLSHLFLKDAYQKVKPLPNVNFIQANGYHLPLLKDSIKVFTLSSFMHEIFSYKGISGESFSKENITIFLSNLLEHLKTGGLIIIKDPAKPENPDEILNFKIGKTDGITSSDHKELQKYPVRELSTYSRFIRFIYEFKALENNPELQNLLKAQVKDSNEGVFLLPAWVISEFLRHRDLCVTDDNWESEMMEQYGTLTENDLRDLADSLNLKVKKIKIYNNKTHYSAVKNGEITVMNQNNNPINLKNRFPTNLVAVLEKNNSNETELDAEKVSRTNVAAVITDRDGKILYCQRSGDKKFLPGIWHLPGGEVETDEQPAQALGREIKEELNLNIDKIKQTQFQHIYPNDQGENHATLFFLAQASGEITLDFENQAYKFLSIEELPDYLEPNVLELNQKICKVALSEKMFYSKLSN